VVNMQSNNQILKLDGLRGIAALYVAFLHATEAIPQYHFLFVHAHLAVDLFFGLSGYVLARAYTNDLLIGRLTFSDFLVKRFIRLLPLVILGVVLGTIALTVKVCSIGETKLIVDLIISCFLNCLMLPSNLLLGVSDGNSYFPNPPTWSMSAEMLASLFFVLWLYRTPVKALVSLLILTSIGLLASGIHFGKIDHGWEWDLQWMGHLRMLFSFTLGLLLYRTQKYWADRLLALGAWQWFPFVLMCVVFMLPVHGSLSGLYEWVCVIVVFPIIIGMVIASRPMATGKAVMLRLGELSFPIYALHYPVFRFMQPMRQKLIAMDLAFLAIVLQVLVAASFAWLMYLWFDKPVRAWLTNAWKHRLQF
jgi:peptidoglycan/LPS O-acetylase OafA/YrhL